MVSYQDDGYGSGGTLNSGESFGANAMGTASDFTTPVVSTVKTFLGDAVESLTIIVSKNPIAKGIINIFVVLLFVYCAMALLFPRHLRGALRAIRTPA